MAPQHQTASIVTLSVLLAFLAGIGGNIFSDSLLLPRLNAALEGRNGITNSSPVVEREKVIERTTESAIVDGVKDVSPSVVSIIASKSLPNYYANPYDFFFGNPFGFDPFFQGPVRPTPQPEQREKQKVGGGTGFIVTSTGLVMTNRHVVDDAEAEYTIIAKDGTEYGAEIVTKDPVNDMAFVRMKAKGPSPTGSEDGKQVNNMPVVKFVPDAGRIQVGQGVIAIGNALSEFDNTVTTGVVSGKGRQITAGVSFSETEDLRNLIQTDASINPGNSGGPLVNLLGEVIGINTAVAAQAQGIGFAIPLDQRVIGRLLDQVNKYGKIVRPYLGVRYVSVTPELNRQYKLGTDRGSWIRADQDMPAVIPGTPAAKAGLKGGDIVLRINGQTLDDKTTLQDAISDSNPGDAITLTILRDGREQDVKVVLEERKE